ncbi:MAG: glycosyltransferase family 39 protein [Anaerolineae bacterium]|jgi:4-amino-4-deoxy-L-arabinose transferase-like glycosyltransferase|nr:glycosyltransferase family 39 protein [Anaerolineae bacterium]
MRSRRDTGLLLLFLLLILGIAAAVRFYNLDSQSLWADEGNSAALAARSLTQITRDAANDIHPPLYYWLLRLWTAIFGFSEAALRSLSAVLGVLLVLTIAELGRRIYHSAAGLAAGLVAALAPFQVYYSQEARMYILVALLASVSVLLFWWLLSQEDVRLPCQAGQRRRVRWLPFSGQLLVLAWTAGLYTHYAFPLIIALCSGVYALWLIASRSRGCVGQRVARWFLFLALSLGLYAPWLATAVRQLTSWPAPNATIGLVEQVHGIVSMLAFGPVPAPATLPWAPVLFLIALAGAWPWPYFSRDGQAGSARLDWLRSLLPLAWLLAPVLMILALGLYRGSYLKFLLIGSPALALLVARAALGPAGQLLAAIETPEPSARGRRSMVLGVLAVTWVLGVIAITFSTFSAGLLRYFNDPAAARDDYRGISHFIDATSQPNDAILLNAPGQGEVFGYYYDGELPVYPLPRQRPLDPAQTEIDLANLLSHDKIYALYWATDESDPQGFVEHWLDQRGYKTLDQWHGNARLAVYVMPEQRPPDEVVDALDARLGDRITLEGYQGWNLNPTAGEVTQVQLTWRADQPPDRNYKVFLQLLDARNQVIAQRDAQPAGESRPTTTWAAGEPIFDNHGVLIPPGTPPGSYRRIVGLYDAETGERLKLADGSDFVSLPPVNVQRAKTPPTLDALSMMDRQSFDFGAITLLGHDQYKRGYGHNPDEPILAGDLLHLTFYWRANVAPRADWWFELALSDGEGKPVATMRAPLVSDTYLTTLWQDGEVVRGEHDLQIPPDLPPDTYRLSLTMMPDEKTEAGGAYLGAVRVQRPQ